MALLRELSFLPLNSRDEFTTLRKFLAMEEFKSEHLAEELEIATHFLKEPEAAEIRDILMERAAVGDVKRAAAFYKIIRYSYGSGCTSYGCQPFDIRKTFTIIWEANRRLKDTVIENKDFEALIRQYDRPNAFFYCDPPYFETEGHYEVVFRKEDHVRLRDEFNLDRYEGYPRLYGKEMLEVELDGKREKMMAYTMTEGYAMGVPSEHYLATIRTGYQEAGFDEDVLMAGVEKSRERMKQEMEAERMEEAPWSQQLPL